MRIGVDLGGTKIEGIVLTDEGEVTEKLRVDTPAQNYSEPVKAVYDVIKKLQTTYQFPVGIGTPGALSLPD